MIPGAVVLPGVDGVEVAKVAPLRLTVLDGPALRVTHADASVVIDGEPGDGDFPLSTQLLAEDNGGGLSKGGLAVDPRKLGDGWAYEIKAEGRRIVWAPTATTVPSWANEVDLFIGPAERGDFTGRLADADSGTSFLLRRGGLARKAAEQADPTGEWKARHLIRWYERGPGAALIAWGTPGAFDRCTKIAGKHMRPDQAKGFCNLRSKGATGRYAGETRKALLARLLVAYRGHKIEEVEDAEDADDDVSQSAMVALYPSREVAEALALEGGESVDELHVTLAYLGSDATEKLDLQTVVEALGPVANDSPPLDGSVSGLGRFTAGYPAGQEPWPLYASVDLPALPAFRQRLVAALEAAGVEVASEHGFSPHLTLAYVEPEDEPVASLVLSAGVKPLPLHFGEVVLAWGDARLGFPLSREFSEPAGHVRGVAGPVVKSIDAKRYTLGPMYLASPDNPTLKDLDAHGEFVTRDDLQSAVWDYVRSGDRSLRLQHTDGTSIGEWVEIMAWPTESEFPLTLPTGEVVTKRFPAGTVFMGAVWNDVGWDLVIKGKLRAYSLGGTAQRVAVEVT